MRMFTRTVAALLLVALLPATFPAPSAVAAAGGGGGAAAAAADKDEVIYVMAGADGSVEEIYAVNAFPAGSTVTDRGGYTEVRMLTTDDEIRQDGDRINFSSAADGAVGRVYYQGTLQEAQIPWDISIRYFLDGKERSAAELAGGSGRLEIRFSVKRNTGCGGTYYDDFALQSTFRLDTGLCTGIRAPEATIASAGKDRLITFTILPGKGIDTSIYADVHDFEMVSVTMDGLLLRFDAGVDGDGLQSDGAKLEDGLHKMANGAGALADGAAGLADGSVTLAHSTGALADGALSMDAGLARLKEGIGNARDALDALNAQSSLLATGSARFRSALETVDASLTEISVQADGLAQLVTASGIIRSAIAELQTGASLLKDRLSSAQYKASLSSGGVDVDALRAGNEQAAAGVSALLPALRTALQLAEGTLGQEVRAAQLRSQIALLETLPALLKGNNAALGGTERYLGSVEGAAGEIAEGLGTLQQRYAVFDSGIAEAAGTLGAALPDLSKLAEGIRSLTDQYVALDVGIVQYTTGVDGLAEGFEGIVGGIAEVARGWRSLAEGVAALNRGVMALRGGATDLSSGTAALASGAAEAHRRVAGMDSRIDGILKSLQGKTAAPLSFVSEKNGQIASLQFAIKTAPIELVETAEVETPETAPQTFWQKLLALFR